MTAPNHAMTGALIGLTIGNPVLALIVAFLSHFICDAIPHYDPYDPKKVTPATIIQSKRFFREQIVIGGVICYLVVLFLVGFHPTHWLLAAFCAFIAASPDVLFLPRFIHNKRTGQDNINAFWFWKFHHKIQWKTGPKFIWLEALWFLIMVRLVAVRL